jgi:GrxC family glutaredoxin
MTDIEIYTREWCSYCEMAKMLLDSKGLTYREIDVTSDAVRKQEMIQRSGRHTMPQVFIGSQSIGGYDDLLRFNATGELDRILGITNKT